MADKKVERSRPDLVINPTQTTTSSLSDSGTINMAESTHDKGRSALIDKFRRREERWRLEQSLHDREAAAASAGGKARGSGGEQDEPEAEGPVEGGKR